MLTSITQNKIKKWDQVISQCQDSENHPIMSEKTNNITRHQLNQKVASVNQVKIVKSQKENIASMITITRQVN
jgi:hypothetical protein